MLVAKSVLFFVIAGLCEIGGGYLLWMWLRHGRSGWWALPGAAVLILYGIVATFQPAHFGRVYAAYGGVFIALSILWGWAVDRVRPDRYDLAGGTVCLAGMVIIMYWPRH